MEFEMMFQVGGEQKESLDESDREKVAAYVHKRVGEMRCPDHDQLPSVVCHGGRLDAVRFEVKGCCQKIIHLVQRKLDE